MNHLPGMPMHFVYVASRADGFHKIGVTCNARNRCKTLSALMSEQHRPIILVHEFELGTLAPLIEKVAHQGMIDRGYEMQPLEWFEASARVCANAVRRAISLINEIGVNEWTKRRIKARRAWRRENGLS